MFDELGISLTTAIVILISLYYVVKGAVKNGILEAYENINEEKNTESDEYLG